MSFGATLYVASTSEPVGAISLAPGTTSRAPIAVSMLLPVAMRPDGSYLANTPFVKVCANWMKSSVKTLGAVA